ncbi:MAG: phosphoribosylanthranilate isomerase [Verrucomicrobiales bacterium]|nr:phosphoribosylanthranilate isomerase [Verrucomicrobiales bacterium]
MNLPVPPPTVRVKICGITRVEDALAAVQAGADALGFMFYPPSPRYLSVEQAAAITRELPPFVARVGVFVDASEERVREAASVAGLDTLQFHGKETPEYCRSFVGWRVLKAFRMQNAASLQAVEAYRGMAWLLDSYVAGAFGGTGQTFNWDLACEAVRRGGSVVLAGGLTVDNIARAVAAVGPYAVDVSSGVESEPGRKDPALLRAFVKAAKEV